jgi:hypothetical protein
MVLQSARPGVQDGQNGKLAADVLGGKTEFYE